MRVAITGAEGLVGGILRRGLGAEYVLHPLVRSPQAFPAAVVDVGDTAALEREFSGVDAVIHLAAEARLDAPWDLVLESNIRGTRNVYEAARRAGVKRVVFASSGHVLGLAEERAGPGLYELGDARVFDENTPCEPDSLYAVSKVHGEALGRYYAEALGLEVVSVRLGTVVADDNPRTGQVVGRGRSASMSYAERYPRIRAKWLSHRDCCELFSRCVAADAVKHAVVFGTSNNPRQIWSLENARRVLGYHPRDAAPVEP